MRAAMMENALPIAAFGAMGRAIFADVRKNGRKIVVDGDRPVFVLQTAEEYEKIMDLIEDMRIGQIAAERLSKPRGTGTPFEDVLGEFGMSEKDLEGWENVEIDTASERMEKKK